MDNVQLRKGDRVQRPVKRDDRTRSELTLLWELIQRNPERAKEFLRRLAESKIQQCVVK